MANTRRFASGAAEAVVTTAALLLIPLTLTNAFYLKNGNTFRPRGSHAMHMSMRPTYDALSAKVVEKLGLQETDFTETFEGKTWSCPNTGTTGTAEWMSEESPKFLTGVTLATRQEGATEKLTLNVWMGPSYDVPHMLITFGEQDGSGKYAVTADYVTRGVMPIGSAPAYIETYYGEDVVSAWTAIVGLDGVTESPSPASFDSRVLHSPVRLSVDGLEKADAESFVAAHVDRFLGWLDEAQPIPARSRGSMNLRDDKLRQYFFRGQVQEAMATFGGELGLTVGAVNTGPTAEAYVGGGS